MRPRRPITVSCTGGYRQHHWTWSPRWPVPTDHDWRCIRCLRWYDECTRRVAA